MLVLFPKLLNASLAVRHLRTYAETVFISMTLNMCRSVLQKKGKGLLINIYSV